MRRNLKIGEKIWFLGKEATVLCCDNDQILIHTLIKRVLWINLNEIDAIPEAAV